MPLFESLIAPALKSVSDLIGQFHMSPEEKIQAQQAIADASQKAQLAAMDYDVRLNQIASDNIKVEAASSSWVVADARPSVIWMGNIVLLLNYCLFPIFGWHHGEAVVFPEYFWVTWGAIVLGYVTSRGMEKISQMPGDSQINLAGIVKIGNKS